MEERREEGLAIGQDLLVTAASWVLSSPGSGSLRREIPNLRAVT
jgi:hypothetical protein